MLIREIHLKKLYAVVTTDGSVLRGAALKLVDDCRRLEALAGLIVVKVNERLVVFKDDYCTVGQYEDGMYDATAAEVEERINTFLALYRGEPVPFLKRVAPR